MLRSWAALAAPLRSSITPRFVVPDVATTAQTRAPLAAAGSDAYRDAVEDSIRVAREAAVLIHEHPHLELLREPDLSIVAFTRTGWDKNQYQQWSDQLLEDQIGFVTPSSHLGQPILRFAIVNPWTTIADIKTILATL